MANVDVIRFKWGDDNFIALEYNDNNLRARRIHVNISAGRTVRALVWDTDQGGDPSDPATAFIDVTFVGPTVDSFNVPGSFQLVEVTDEAGTYHDVPPNIKYQFIERFSG